MFGNFIMGKKKGVAKMDDSKVEESTEDVTLDQVTPAESLDGEKESVTDTILLESGDRIKVAPHQEKHRRVQDLTGKAYDHCHDASDGEWVYRPC